MKRYYLAALIGLFLIPVALLAPTAYEVWRSQPAQELSPHNPYSPANNPSTPTALTLYDGGKPVKT